MFKKLTLIGGLLALLVIILGAYVRLSNAGLGCPDWPGCYGHAMVSDSQQFKEFAVQNYPEQALDTSKAWKEMTHRYFAGALALVIIALLPFAWRLTKQRAAAIGLSLALIFMVFLQAALGMWTVQFKVMPIVVTAHMLLGFSTFWLLAWTYLRCLPDISIRQTAMQLRWFALIASIVLLAQTFLGGWLSSNYAALICGEFPRCQGLWWPNVDYVSALNIFNVGLNDPSLLSADSKVAIHVLHRFFALICFAVLFLLVWFTTNEQQPKAIRRSGVLLSVLLLIQILLGIFSVKHDLPLWASVAHNAFAAILMLPILSIAFFCRYSFAESPVAEASIAPLVIDEVSQPIIEVVVEELDQPLPAPSLFNRLKSQLQKTRGGLGQVINALAFKSTSASKELLEELEASLIMADLGIETSQDIIKQLSSQFDSEQLKNGELVSNALKDNLYAILQPCSQPLVIPEQDLPYVILVVGVNGVGKTTTIGKLAHRLQSQGYSVMLAAGDTFRAAAVEQLQTWGERNNVPVVAQHTGADSASVIFDGLQSAQAKGIQVLIADTAGRLHTKSNLMEELKKIKRIMAKLDANAPHEVLLILDAGTGQNALSQARQFNETVNLTGLALTKLDGTAKGGIIFALAKQLGLPIRFVGVGEGIEDLQDFDARIFIDALFAKD